MINTRSGKCPISDLHNWVKDKNQGIQFSCMLSYTWWIIGHFTRPQRNLCANIRVWDGVGMSKHDWCLSQQLLVTKLIRNNRQLLLFSLKPVHAYEILELYKLGLASPKVIYFYLVELWGFDDRFRDYKLTSKNS